MTRPLAVEPLEDRTLLTADFGLALGLGGTENEVGYAIATDAAGNVYVTGGFRGTVDFDPGPGTVNLTGAGNPDIFVAKYSSAGALDWAHGFGSSGDDRGHGIAVDETGNVYVTGWFSGTIDFDPGSGISNLSTAGSLDVFVLKLDTSGSFVWAGRAGGQNTYVVGTDVAVDSAGDVYIGGHGNFSELADFDPGPGTSNVIVNGGGPNDVFVWKLDSAGNFAWAVGMGGGGDDHFRGITVDAVGNVYTTGDFQYTVDFDPGSGSFSLSSSGSYDVFVQKLDASGNFIWAGTMGGSSQDVPLEIALDSAGDMYITGGFEGTMDFDPGPGVFNITSVGAADAFVSKLDSSGSFIWARSVGSSGDEHGWGIAIDGSDNVWITGSFMQTADFDPGPDVFNLTSTASGGERNSYVWQLDSSGDFLDAGAMLSSARNDAMGIALDATGSVYTTGCFSGTADFDPGPETFNLTSAGYGDVFIWKLTQVQTVQIDVKPGSDPNSVNLASNGQIAVALFTTEDFDASQVDVGTLVFAGASAVKSSLEDVDGDGDLDLVLHFWTQETNLREMYDLLLADDINEDGMLDSNHQELEVSLSGHTLLDQAFEGVDELELLLSGKGLRSLLDELAAVGAI